jgi:hypothetical protein
VGTSHSPFHAQVPIKSLHPYSYKEVMKPYSYWMNDSSKYDDKFVLSTFHEDPTRIISQQ